MHTLDIGCGFEREYHIKKAEIGIDLNRGICDVVGDAQFLPFRDSIFDEVFVYQVLEHLDNPMQCLREISRVANKNAVVKFAFPVDARACRMDLKRLILEFPFSIPSLFKRYWAGHKYKKFKGRKHKSNITPHHITVYFNILSVEKEVPLHAWFWGRKGKSLQKLFSQLPRSITGASWYIEAEKKK